MNRVNREVIIAVCNLNILRVQATGLTGLPFSVILSFLNEDIVSPLGDSARVKYMDPILRGYSWDWRFPTAKIIPRRARVYWG